MKKPAAVLLVLSLAVLALALVPAAGLAAKGGGGGSGGGHGGGGKPAGGSGGSSSLAVVMVSDTNGNGSPNWGDTITFNVTTTASNPYVTVTCTQNGVVVYTASAGFYDGYLWPGARNMPLSSPAWTGGAASCTADLNSDLATLSFGVAA